MIVTVSDIADINNVKDQTWSFNQNQTILSYISDWVFRRKNCIQTFSLRTSIDEMRHLFVGLKTKRLQSEYPDYRNLNSNADSTLGNISHTEQIAPENLKTG